MQNKDTMSIIIPMVYVRSSSGVREECSVLVEIDGFDRHARITPIVTIVIENYSIRS